MSSFQDYIKTKYPSYFVQKNLCDNSNKKNPNDLDAENIEKSLSYRPSFRKPNQPSQNNVNNNNAKLLNIRKKLSPHVKIFESNSMIMSKKSANSRTDYDGPMHMTNGGLKLDRFASLEGYDLDEFKTSPPIGWKRPTSRVSMFVNMMLENKKSSSERNLAQGQKSGRTGKEIYLEAIYREDVAGQIFMKYLMNKNKTFAINRLKCLEELIKYKDLFYDENFNQESVKRYALEIYSKYIAVSASNSIDCSKADRLKLHHLFSEPNSVNNIGKVNANVAFKPTYEDTFDAIEEFLLLSLYDEWKTFMEAEDSYFSHNEIENIERSINIKSKKIDQLLENGLIKMIPKSAVNSEAGTPRRALFADPNSYSQTSSTWDIESSNLFSNNRSFSLNDLLNNTRDFEAFKKFLDSKNSLYDILCWMDIEAYTRIDNKYPDKIEEHARMLKRKYLNKKYFFAKNGPVDESTQNLILEKIGGWNVILQDVPPNLLILMAKNFLENKLKHHWLPMYFTSEFCAKSEYNTRTQMMDVVDDIMHLKKKKMASKEESKLKKHRWLYSSQMVINFGKALRNSFTTKVFSKYLKVKSAPNHSDEFDLELSNSLVNNLQFLVEVQDYKEMCQKTPEDERSILFKMNHIIDCFINNRIPPRTRVDIPDHVADNIIEQKDYLSPYLFLEANLTVFNALMPHWVEFNHMRSEKDLDLFDEFSSFKKLKDFNTTSKNTASSTSLDGQHSADDQSVKWRYNQYIKALKTQLVI